jgi:hypothetical protein
VWSRRTPAGATALTGGARRTILRAEEPGAERIKTKTEVVYDRVPILAASRRACWTSWIGAAGGCRAVEGAQDGRFSAGGLYDNALEPKLEGIF